MKKLKDKSLVVIASSGLAVAILSVFTTIVSYTNSKGIHRSFALLDFLADGGNGYDQFVSYEYTGKIYLDVDISVIRVFVVIGIIAMVCAVVGLMLISKQRENTVSFVLTLAGLIGTMAPSLLILVCLVILKDQYSGTISCGLYPIISPIAMIVCIAAATQMRRRNMEYRKKLKEAEGLIFRGGDL